ncbi:MAG: multiheme c-type cytochrome [Syntrophothermus sp.]
MKRSLLVFALVLLGWVAAAAQTVNIHVEALNPIRKTALGITVTTQSNVWSTGLKVVPAGARVFVSADTTGSVSTFNWSIVSAPTGSAAKFDSAGRKFTAFTADVAGTYIVKVTGGTASDQDTIYAQTYQGLSTVGGTQTATTLGCNTCHQANYTSWVKTPHANIFKEGVTGLLEVEAGKGAYATTCMRCHTTGYDTKLNNGNFGYVTGRAGITTFDTTWYKPNGQTILEFRDGDYWTPSGNTRAWDYLVSNYKDAVSMATIGCESCHGPGKEHMGDKKKIGNTWDAGVCNQCHEASAKHRIGQDWEPSSHAVWADGSHTAQGSCFPCHSGSAFAKWASAGKPKVTTTTSGTSFVGKDAAGKVIWETSDGAQNLSCQACHDPHGNDNPNALRTVKTDSLLNSYKITWGGKGQLCMSCHVSRKNGNTVVTNTAPLYGWADRFNPHHSNQTDMLVGQNAYEFGNPKPFLGKVTHKGVEDACVTCHMQPKADVGSPLSNHGFNMTYVDSKTGQTKDMIYVCQNCHGKEVTSFDDIKGEDYDGNGVVEGAMVEVKNLVTALEKVLPKDATGAVVSMKADSAKIYGKKALVAGVYNYWFVMNDGSMGAHNTKYAVALLQQSLNQITGVEFKNSSKPESYVLGQNYPNPFNPTTQIEFSLPKTGNVKLNVYNSVGQLVATLANGEVVRGNYKVSWNGRDLKGNMVASGVYLYRLDVTGNGSDFSVTKKMVFAK